MIFKEDLEEHSQVRMVDEDVDSVQHLDLSVIGDNHQDEPSMGQMLRQMQMDTERAMLKIDEYDFRNTNLKPKQLLLRPNRSRMVSIFN